MFTNINAILPPLCRRAWPTATQMLGLSALLMLSAAGASHAALLYEIQELQVLPNGTNSAAFGINDAGQVVGQADRDGNGYTQAVRWVDGAPQDLTGLGISGARANAINEADTIVGYTDEFPINAFLWQDGTLLELDHPIPCCSFVRDINEVGFMAGSASVPGIGDNYPGYWEDGVFHDLGYRGEGYATNEARQIVGYKSLLTGQVAFLWQDGVTTELGTLGGNDSWAYDINESGAVVGVAENASEQSTPFLWQDGVISALPTLGGQFGYAYAINDLGHIVGAAYPPAPSSRHAVLWLDGEVVDLIDHVVTDEDWSLGTAHDINNAGQIVGQGTLNGQPRGFLLTPIATLGDLDGDGDVDQADLGILLASYGVDDGGDLDGDGDTDQADLGVLLANYGL